MSQSLSASLLAPCPPPFVGKYFTYVKLTADTATASVILPEHKAHSGHTLIKKNL